MSDNFSDFDNLVDLFTTIRSKLLEKAHIYVGTRDAWDQLTVAEKTAYQFTAFLGDTESGIVDDVPTQNSNNLVKSGGVYSQYETLENEIDTVSAQVSDNDDAYSPSKPYKVGALCIHDNKLYRCITACSAAAWSVNSSCFTQKTLTNAVDELNSNLSNNFGTVATVPFSTPYTCPSDGMIRYGAYGTTSVILAVNGLNIGVAYGGGQTYISIFNTYKVRKGDILTLTYNGTASEANINHFIPYS